MNIHQNPYDLFEPTAGHRERFERKLKARFEPRRRKFSIKRELAVASVLILLGLFFMNDSWKSILYGDKIYPKVIEKQEEISDYLKENFLTWEKFETPESRKLIEETYQYLERLDNDYNKLRREFHRTGNRFVLDAMIENTKRRDKILQDLKTKLIQIEKMKRYENRKHSL